MEDGHPDQAPDGGELAGADRHLQHHRHAAALQRAAGAAGDHQRHQQLLHPEPVRLHPGVHREQPELRGRHRRGAGAGDVHLVVRLPQAGAATLGRRVMAAGPYPGAPAGSARVTRGGLLATAFMFVCAVYFLLPAWWLVVSSTKGPSTLYASEGFWFSQLHLASNLTGLFTYDGGIYWHWLVNTLLYAGAGALCATALASAAGYALAKYEFRGRQLVFSVVLGGVLVPGTALALPLYLLLSKVSLTNTYWSVFLPSVVSPFGVYLARVYAASAIPDERPGSRTPR